MKIEHCSVVYYPFIVEYLIKVEKNDLRNGVLTLPNTIGKVSDNALPINLKPNIINIPNDDIIIGNRIKKCNSTLVLQKGEKISELFNGVKAKKIILPNELKSIKRPGFNKSIIDEIEIPDNVEKCEDIIFNGARINHLIINKKLLNQINAKFLTLIKTEMKLTIKNSGDDLNLAVLPLTKREVKEFNFSGQILDNYLNILRAKPKNKDVDKLIKLITEHYVQILNILNKGIISKNNNYISINNIINLKYMFNDKIKSISNNLPNISTDGYSIVKDDKKIKILSLEDVLNKRNLI